MLILIVDDEAGVRNSLHQLLKRRHDCLMCADGEEALRQLEKTSVDLVITDNQMPKLTGIELLRRAKETSPGTAFLLMTAFGTVEQAIEAIRLGADDYVMKPFDLSEMEHRIDRVEKLRLLKTEQSLKLETKQGTARLVGKSVAIARAKEFVASVADAPSPVLLLGPSGSGKEVLAKAIHESGVRSHRPFVAINCASLSESLIESELFGHEKGAFTGATSAKPGKFELAQGGTLFLDEIGEIPPSLQAKLLRVLQEKEFYRVGGIRQIKCDVRVIAATHRPLKEMVKQGTFREDLFFRMNVLTLEVPPLSERPDDIPVLVDFFWSRLSRDFAKQLSLSPDTLAVLCRYGYPGNVRELQNVLERLMVLTPHGGVVPPEALPPEFRGASNVRSLATGSAPPDLSLGLTAILDFQEEVLVREAMEKSNHNQMKAAQLLKITRGALQYKLRKYGLLKAAA